MDQDYHFQPDLFKLLVDGIPKLCRSKRDVLNFFRSCGMPSSSLDPLEERLRTQRDAIKKREIAETLLHEMNKAGDALLGVRRQLIKRIVEFDDFSSCYPDDQLAATGFVTRA